MKTIILTVGLALLTIQGTESWWLFSRRRRTSTGTSTQSPMSTESPGNISFSCDIKNFVPASAATNTSNITLHIKVYEDMFGETENRSCEFSITQGEEEISFLGNEEVCQNVYKDETHATGCNITCELDAKDTSDGSGTEIFCGEISTTTTYQQSTMAEEETSHDAVTDKTSHSTQVTTDLSRRTETDTTDKSQIKSKQSVNYTWIIAPVAGGIILIIVLMVACWKLRKRKNPLDDATTLSTFNTPAQQRATNVYEEGTSVTAETKENPLYGVRDDVTEREMVDNVLYGST